MAVIKIIELVGSSSTGSDDAVQAALKEAQATLRNIKAVDVVSVGLRGDNLDEWRAHVRVCVPDRARQRVAQAQNSPSWAAGTGSIAVRRRLGLEVLESRARAPARATCGCSGGPSASSSGMRWKSARSASSIDGVYSAAAG